jgi:hypothetical protein
MSEEVRRIVPRDGWYHGLRKTAATFKPVKTVKIEELSEKEEKEEEDQNREE